MELDKLQLNVCVTNTIRLDSTHYWQNTITDCGISKCTGMAVGNHLLLITMESVRAPPKHSSYYKTLLVHTRSDLKALALGLWKWEVISDFNFISGRSNQVCPCEFRLLLHSLKRPFRALAVRAPPFCDFTQRANICWGMNQIKTCSPGFFLKFDSFIQQNNLSKVNLSLWSSICPVASERGYWKNCGAYLHVSVGHFENRGGFWPHLPLGQLPTTNLALLQLFTWLGKTWHTRGELEGDGASTKYHREGDLENKMDHIQIR